MGDQQNPSSTEDHHDHPECVSNHDTESFSWIDKSKTRELLALPFDGMFHLSDEYELALISLYKKRWSYRQIAFLHFVLFAPLLEWPTKKMSSLVGFGDLLKRFILSAGLIYGLFWGLQKAMLFAHLEHLFPLMATLLGLSLLLLHVTLAMDTFQHWKFAYEHMDRGLLKAVKHRVVKHHKKHAAVKKAAPEKRQK